MAIAYAGRDPAMNSFPARITFLAFLTAAACLVAFVNAPAHAETTWYVDDDAANDPGPGDPDNSDPAEDGSAEHPFDAIQEALNTASDADTIIVKDGTYTGLGNRDIDFGGKAIYLGSENGLLNCIIDCQGSESDPHRGFYFHSGEDAGSVVDGFTIKNGYGPSGTAIHCEASSPTVTNNTITANVISSGGGGGIACYDNSSATIMGNSITTNVGAAVYCEFSSPTITDNFVAGNIYCGISCFLCPSPVITSNVIIDNRAEGIFFSSSALTTISGNIITGNAGFGISCNSAAMITRNTVAANMRGGIYSSSESTIMDNVIVTNTTDYFGGGIRAYSGAQIYNNVITSNTASTHGGGIHCATDTHICNNIIVGNTVTGPAGKGGGISISGLFASPQITSNTILGNMAQAGGGIWSGSRCLSIANNILYYNIADTGPQGYLNPTADLTTSYCNVQDGPAGFYIAQDATLNWGEGNINTEPLFADPNNGDYHLKSEYGRCAATTKGEEAETAYDDITSPCIDAGDPGADYANEPMPNYGRVNMGAYGNTEEASKSGWNIPGDTNDDCKVDILDMIPIRNDMGQPVDSSNWKCDVTDDGQINILDMIFVRNCLYTACTE